MIKACQRWTLFKLSLTVCALTEQGFSDLYKDHSEDKNADKGDHHLERDF